MWNSRGPVYKARHPLVPRAGGGVRWVRTQASVQMSPPCTGWGALGELADHYPCPANVYGAICFLFPVTAPQPGWGRGNGRRVTQGAEARACQTQNVGATASRVYRILCGPGHQGCLPQVTHFPPLPASLPPSLQKGTMTVSKTLLTLTSSTEDFKNFVTLFTGYLNLFFIFYYIYNLKLGNFYTLFTVENVFFLGLGEGRDSGRGTPRPPSAGRPWAWPPRWPSRIELRPESASSQRWPQWLLDRVCGGADTCLPPPPPMQALQAVSKERLEFPSLTGAKSHQPGPQPPSPHCPQPWAGSAGCCGKRRRPCLS